MRLQLNGAPYFFIVFLLTILFGYANDVADGEPCANLTKLDENAYMQLFNLKTQTHNMKNEPLWTDRWASSVGLVSEGS